MDNIQLLNLILIIVIVVLVALGGIAILLIYRMKNKESAAKKEKEEMQIAANGGDPKKIPPTAMTRTGVGIKSIYEFMEFDEVKDGMIVRKNHKQYVMVIDCRGINYDLLSEVEKEGVEAAFIEMLNTLRFPVQLYVQTRTLNLTNLLNEYKRKTDDLSNQITRLISQARQARDQGNTKVYDRITFEIKRKQNILEYGESLEDYTARINESKNILQQKTYLIISYYPSEAGDTSKYSSEELVDIAFNELYTRAQTLIGALSSADVVGKVMNSEELAELLYVAYNRDASESFTLRDAINSDYTRLYSTARDVLEDKKRRIEAQVEQAAAQLASQSLVKADNDIRAERANKVRMVKEKAKEMVDEYKDDISKPLYERTQKAIDDSDAEAILSEAEKLAESQGNN